MRAKRAGIVAVAIGALVAMGMVPAGAAPTVTQIVRAQTANGWFSFNEGDPGTVGTATLVTGPGTLPAGTGSIQLTADQNGRASIGTNQFAGTRLDQLTGLSYSVFVPTAAGQNYPTLQFDVDFNLNDANTTFQGRLSFNLPSVTLGTWTPENALAGDYFRSTAALTASPLLACGQSCTIGDVLAAYPNAGIRNDPVVKGALILRLGGPLAPGGATVYADAVTVSTNLLTTFVDFEPGSSVAPTIGPAGSLVVVSGYGFKPGKKIVFKYRTFAPGRKYVLLCKVAADGGGVATCVANIPTGVSAGNIGIHPILIKGRGPTGPIQYQPEFFRSA